MKEATEGEGNSLCSRAKRSWTWGFHISLKRPRSHSQPLECGLGYTGARGVHHEHPNPQGSSGYLSNQIVKRRGARL